MPEGTSATQGAGRQECLPHLHGSYCGFIKWCRETESPQILSEPRIFGAEIPSAVEGSGVEGRVLSLPKETADAGDFVLYGDNLLADAVEAEFEGTAMSGAGKTVPHAADYSCGILGSIYPLNLESSWRGGRVKSHDEVFKEAASSEKSCGRELVGESGGDPNHVTTDVKIHIMEID